MMEKVTMKFKSTVELMKNLVSPNIEVENHVTSIKSQRHTGTGVEDRCSHKYLGPAPRPKDQFQMMETPELFS